MVSIFTYSQKVFLKANFNIWPDKFFYCFWIIQYFL